MIVHIFADFDCNYWQIENVSMAIPIEACISSSNSINDSQKHSNSTQCIYDKNSLEIIDYDHERTCGSSTNSIIYNDTQALNNGIKYNCSETNINKQCDYVEFVKHGPHPIKCDDYWHQWEHVSYLIGCYSYIVNRNDNKHYKSAYYGCNDTNIIIKYYSDNLCQNILQTKVIESCECQDLDCYSYQVLNCTNSLVI